MSKYFHFSCLLEVEQWYDNITMYLSVLVTSLWNYLLRLVLLTISTDFIWISSIHLLFQSTSFVLGHRVVSNGKVNWDEWSLVRVSTFYRRILMQNLLNWFYFFFHFVPCSGNSIYKSLRNLLYKSLKVKGKRERKRRQENQFSLPFGSKFLILDHFLLQLV